MRERKELELLKKYLAVLIGRYLPTTFLIDIRYNNLKVGTLCHLLNLINA